MKKLAVAVLLGSLCTTAHADFIGLFVGGGNWQSDFQGDIINNVNLNADLNLDGSTATWVYVAFEHPIPIIPNIRLDHTTLDDTGDGVLSADISFAGQDFTASQPVLTTLDLTHTDVTLYYEIIDTGFDLDIGVTARVFDGEVIVNSAREEVEGTMPMFYTHIKVGLPFTGTYVRGNIKTVGSTHSDYNAAIGWETENAALPEFGIEGGYRSIQVDADTDDIDVNVDTEFDGVYIMLNAHF